MAEKAGKNKINWNQGHVVSVIVLTFKRMSWHITSPHPFKVNFSLFQKQRRWRMNHEHNPYGWQYNNSFYPLLLLKCNLPSVGEINDIQHQTPERGTSKFKVIPLFSFATSLSTKTHFKGREPHKSLPFHQAPFGNYDIQLTFTSLFDLIRGAK